MIDRTNSRDKSPVTPVLLESLTTGDGPRGSTPGQAYVVRGWEQDSSAGQDLPADVPSIYSAAIRLQIRALERRS